MKRIKHNLPQTKFVKFFPVKSGKDLNVLVSYLVGLLLLVVAFCFLTNRTLNMRAFESRLDMDQFKLELANYWTNYRMTRPKIGHCNGAKIFVAIMTTSTYKSYAQRMAIRRYMLRLVENQGVVAKFFLGYQPGFRYDLVEQEIKNYDDMVYFDADDNYRNNFVKWYSMYQWHQSYCAEAKYFLKLDDDTAVDIGRLMTWLARDLDGLASGKPDFLACQRFTGMRPVRNKEHIKWYISEKEYPFKFWPTYCYGHTVLMPNTTVGKLYEASKQVRMIHMDDVLYTGLAARIAKVPVIDFEGFREGIHPRYACTEDGLPYPTAVHMPKSPKTMARVMEKLHNLTCSKSDDIDGP